MIFRFYGQILAPEFNITGKKGEKLLDFGCGQGTAVNYFHKKGFNAYGIDTSSNEISIAKKLHPRITNNLAIIDPLPKETDVFFGGNFDVIIAIQSLYYLSNTDLKTRLISLYNNLKPNGVFYATMIGTKYIEYFENSQESEDGMRSVSFKNTRVSLDNHYVNFTESEEDLIKKFNVFEPIHVGFYSEMFRSDEGVRFHYTFVGKKIQSKFIKS